MYIKSSEKFISIMKDYDIFLFDIFGVVWNGREKIIGTDNVLSWLKSIGKTVVFLSNASVPNINVEEHFKSIGILKNIHYDIIVTSGDAARNILFSSGKIFPGKKDYKNCFVIGKLIDENFFKNTIYNRVTEIAEADFVYLAFPQISEKEYLKIKENNTQLQIHQSLMYDDIWYDIMDANIFMDILKESKKYNLPMFNDCADMVAAQTDAKTKEINYVIRQGTLANIYKNMGGEVIEVCKPHSNVYDYTFDLLKKENKFPENSKIIMIGDTIENDILGSTNTKKELNVNIDSVLTLCGVSGKEYNKNIKEINDYCVNNNINLDYIIDDLGIIL